LRDIAKEFCYLGLPYNEWMRDSAQHGDWMRDSAQYGEWLRSGGASERPYYDLSYLKNQIGIIDSTLAFFDGTFNMRPGFGGSYYIERFPFYSRLKDQEWPYFSAECIEMKYYGCRSLLESLSFFWQNTILMTEDIYSVKRGDLMAKLNEMGKSMNYSLLFHKLYGALIDFLMAFEEDKYLFLFPFFVDYALSSPLPHFNYAFGHENRYRLNEKTTKYYWKEISPASVFWHLLEGCEKESFYDISRHCYLGENKYSIKKIMKEYSDIMSLIGEESHREKLLSNDIKYLMWFRTKLGEMIGYPDLLKLCHSFIDEWSRLLESRINKPWIIIVPPHCLYDELGLPCILNLLEPIESQFNGSIELQIMDEFVNDFIKCNIRDIKHNLEWIDYNVYSSKFLHCPFKKEGLRYNCEQESCQGEIPHRCISGEKCSFENYLKQKFGIGLSKIFTQY
jgi:hypothetical protein